ncbi:hypothetical protein EDB89DRAFT_1903705 [Lactarius sanguifluus]|nr:hypothetical protein EDB89DRAFT_1903705 [Lactarius sanguifluus]
MRCLQLSVLFVLAALPFANFAMPPPPPWDDIRIKHTIPPNWEALLPPWHDIRVKHTWNAVPRNWEALGHPPTGTTIDLHVALKPHGENALSDVLYKASDPRSPKYVLSNIPPRTTYLHGQVARPVAPHLDTLDLINSWLGHHAVPSSPISTTHSSSWLKLTGIPVSQANELLGASYQVYRRVGTNDISILRSRHSVGPELAVEDGGICASGNGSQRNLVEIMGYLQDYSSPDDLREFMTECRGDAEDVTFRVAPYSQAIAYLTPHTFYSTGGEVYIQNNELDSDDVWFEWLIYIRYVEKVPLLEFTTSLCNLFSELVCVAPTSSSQAATIASAVGTASPKMAPEESSSSLSFLGPYTVAKAGRSSSPRFCRSLRVYRRRHDELPRGGGSPRWGFSNYFPRPVYQNVVVPAFLEQLGSQYYGSYKRAFCHGLARPILTFVEGRDIYAQALKYFLILGDVSRGRRKPFGTCRNPLGFLNLWLCDIGIYGLNDITSGSNPGCGTDGFTAITGWDPARPAKLVHLTLG